MSQEYFKQQYVGILHHFPVWDSGYMDIHTIITTYNTAVFDTASEILGNERRRKKPYASRDISTRRAWRGSMKQKVRSNTGKPIRRFRSPLSSKGRLLGSQYEETEAEQKYKNNSP